MMKKLWILVLSLLMVLALVACDDQNPDVETTADTTDVTEAVTDAQTQAEETQAETVADTRPQETQASAEAIDGAYALDKIFDSENELLPVEGDFAIDLDAVMAMKSNMNGMNTNISMEMGMAYIVDQENGLKLSMEIPTMGDTVLVYVGDTLYVEMDEGMYCSTITEEDFQALLSELMGGFDMGSDEEVGTESETTPALPETDPMAGIQSMISMIRPSALFAEVSGEKGADGSYSITAMGLSEQANTIIDMIMSSATTPDSTEEDALAADAMLEMFNLDKMTLTFVADKDYVLQSVTVATTMDMSMIYGYESGSQMMADLTMTFAIDRNDQTVAEPENKDAYTPAHWREIFGMETAEMLGLVADENNVIALESANIERLDKQLAYIEEHLEEFETVTFTVDALYNGIDSYDMSEFSDLEMTAHLMGVIVSTEGEEELPTYIDIYVPDEMVEGITIEDATPVTVTFTLMQGDIADAFFDNFIYFQLVSCTAKS